MELETNLGEDMGYYKFESWICPNSECSCEVEINGETIMDKY